jgi:hypothetical protein
MNAAKNCRARHASVEMLERLPRVFKDFDQPACVKHNSIAIVYIELGVVLSDLAVLNRISHKTTDPGPLGPQPINRSGRGVGKKVNVSPGLVQLFEFSFQGVVLRFSFEFRNDEDVLGDWRQIDSDLHHAQLEASIFFEPLQLRLKPQIRAKLLPVTLSPNRVSIEVYSGHCAAICEPGAAIGKESASNGRSERHSSGEERLEILRDVVPGTASGRRTHKRLKRVVQVLNGRRICHADKIGQSRDDCLGAQL